MTIRLGENNYGKRAINLSKIIRKNGVHEIRQISVGVALQGDFDAVHYDGDNTKVLPTDTMKNTVYALAKEAFTGSIEEFGMVLATHFKARSSFSREVKIELSEYNWKRMEIDGLAHPNSFVNGGSEKHVASIHVTETEKMVSAGIRNLMILKTTDSAFKDYFRDEYTTLKEADDRILATECEATWVYAVAPDDYSVEFSAIRDCLLKTFSAHKSLSVQHTLYAMGEAVLQQFDAVKEISLKMPNKHHILFNLQQFDMQNDNDIFIATDEPYGYITGTVVRSIPPIS